MVLERGPGSSALFGINYLAFGSGSEWDTCCPLIGPVKNPNEDAHVRLFAVLRVTWELPERYPQPFFLRLLWKLRKKQF